MQFSDVNQWHRVTDRYVYEASGAPMIEIRVCSASSGQMVEDTEWRRHRARFDGFPRLYYQYVWGRQSPEEQADLLAGLLGGLAPQDMLMLDIEVGSKIADPPGFTRRWVARAEARLGTRPWVYVPKALASDELYDAIGTRVVKAPRYSGGLHRGTPPNWPHHVHQFTDRGPMPGSPDGPGDCNYTELEVADLLARCRLDDPAPARTSKGDDADRRRRAQLLLEG
ncbi:hypothetical protein GCM10023201_40770 [Actinomycetospora corticicola]|uniref:GH25 family lysozyme M1 (1,4-beta-N-acetylmuramidase) n=1 Tax=Actinomycetospora corticicola TaxID=663602 RepID=A0A7Y9DWS8_9PSEU|nr:hypothetical protein [Actinomycetospora corticicola]NYD36839.1 GH25 family lysozyme M1 (1,4-beta-N-acetylmuramidase) [Actinomycetospora corticicola]